MRSVKEWVGKNDDTAVPPRVKVRVVERFKMRCFVCFQPLTTKGMEIDHLIALCNGGQHRENNLVPLCKPCHRLKTTVDVLHKKHTAAVRKWQLGIAKSRRPVPGSKRSPWAKRYDRETGRFKTVRR